VSEVEVDALRVDFSHGRRARPVLDSLELRVEAGETFGLMGHSGCGKSTLLRVLAGVHRVWQGRVTLLDRTLSPGRRLRGDLRREVQMVFQDPYASLHPRHTVERTLREPLQVHRFPDVRERLFQALDEVNLAPAIAPRFPHQLSGGQRQRVAIARALLLRPKLLLLDEPTSALDLSVQAEILNLLNHLKATHGMTLVLVSHDADVIAHMCDRAALMQAGRIERVLGRRDLALFDS
jgi:peptide/nickel transport system ATP-binding protein